MRRRNTATHSDLRAADSGSPAYVHTPSDVYATPYPHAIPDTYSEADRHPYNPSHVHTVSDIYSTSYQYAVPDTYSKAYGDPNSYSDIYSNANPRADRHADQHSVSNRHRDFDTDLDTHTDRYTNTCAVANAYRGTNDYSDTYTIANSTTPIARPRRGRRTLGFSRLIQCANCPEQEPGWYCGKVSRPVDIYLGTFR